MTVTGEAGHGHGLLGHPIGPAGGAPGTPRLPQLLTGRYLLRRPCHSRDGQTTASSPSDAEGSPTHVPPVAARPRRAGLGAPPLPERRPTRAREQCAARTAPRDSPAAAS